MDNAMDKNKFNDELQKKVGEIEQILDGFVPRDAEFQKTIFDAVEYSLMGGGKRLRPMLIMETYRLFGGTDIEVVKPFMAAMEMIHTYSLVHDDLPAMDNDDYRRGRKTTHVVYGEDMGILAGDALLNLAYETAIAGISAEHMKEGVKAAGILARKAGIYGMVGGQVTDVELTGKSMTAEQLDFVFRLKTGALIESSMMIGATLAGAAEDEVNLMEQAGEYIGMAFQIQDDILDIVSTMDELGKPVHSDEKNQKNTYVSIYGMEKAREAVKDYSKKALDIFASLKNQNEFLNALIEELINRRK